MIIVLVCYDLILETLIQSTEIISHREKCNPHEKSHNCKVEATIKFEETNAVVKLVCLPYIIQCNGDKEKILLLAKETVY